MRTDDQGTSRPARLWSREGLILYAYYSRPALYRIKLADLFTRGLNVGLLRKMGDEYHGHGSGSVSSLLNYRMDANGVFRHDSRDSRQHSGTIISLHTDVVVGEDTIHVQQNTGGLPVFGIPQRRHAAGFAARNVASCFYDVTDDR